MENNFFLFLFLSYIMCFNENGKATFSCDDLFVNIPPSEIPNLLLVDILVLLGIFLNKKII